MKAIITAAAIAAFSTAAQAAELGYGLTFGGEAIAEYNVDTEIMSMTFEPVLGYTVQPLELNLEVSTLLNVYEDGLVDATFETMPTLDFRAGRFMTDALEVYGEVSYNLEAEERGDVVIGVAFNF